ncbi:efflux RND transporter periplasmic adaptor subunit [Aquimarina sp. 2201CG5-10]|uniref:efflux RND transporter periplasmic adaptor subunit n=1 Tax=Aquimarina callyspongiae TaxID=3098150 RepID=UPI002AB4DC7C|nr:efflux RND transporter periplasmic adaptor subunit [Aquimarina sp. 2201CG5-10]MDY8134718.1 efflux RND transporter periplasmic adaptor subunit [Aquimarina sp. 2201CG5-10]
MKNSIYVVVAVLVGLLLGYFIFGNKNEKETIDAHDHSTSTSDQMWTCSMHPQVMQPEPGDCPICAMDLIPAVKTEDGLTPDQFRMSKNALALANVQTTNIGMEKLKKNNIVLSGKIITNEEANAIQTAHFSGRIEKLYVNYVGEKINRGQLLVLIYSPELVAAQQELLTVSAIKKTQPDLYQAVKSKLLLWKLSEKQITGIEESGKVKSNFPIYANVSGVVTEKMVDLGNHMSEGQAMFKIANLNSVWASFDAYENMISTLKTGQSISIKTKAFPGEELKATIAFIDPVLQEDTRTVEVRVVLDNKNKKFKPGMFVEGIVQANSNTNNETISIPKSAVLWTGERSVVYVKTDPDAPVFEMREVVLGEISGDDYIVSSGLTTGEEVVTQGTFTIDAAAQLKGKKSMMNKADQ